MKILDVKDLRIGNNINHSELAKIESKLTAIRNDDEFKSIINSD